MAKKFAWNWYHIRREIVDYIGIFIGATITALSLVWLLTPNKIAAGGVSGIAIVFYYLWRWPVALSMLVLNIPLFLACLWAFGPRFGIKTLFGTVFVSLMTQFWDSMVGLFPLTKDPLLASLYGGVVAGIGMGIAFRFRGTTGGTDLAAQLLNRFTGIPVGQALLFCDSAVIILAGLVFRSAELALYAIMTLFITTKVLDAILEGFDYAKAAWIISEHSEEIGQRILHDLQRGATGLSGRGLYSTVKKEVVLCVISRAEEFKLKELVHQIDPGAFIIITDAHEVLGEGFKNEKSLFL